MTWTHPRDRVAAGAVAAVALCLPSLVGFAPAGQAPTSCVEGPAADASPERPHLVDPAGDTPTTVGMSSADVVAAWVSRETDRLPLLDTDGDAWLLGPAWIYAEIGLTPYAFTLHAAVTDLSQALPGARYVFTVDHTGGTTALAAEHTVDGTWRFLHGSLRDTPSGVVFDEQGWTTGEVDAAAGTISLELVGEFQLPPAVGGDRSIGLTFVGSELPIVSQQGHSLAPRDVVPRAGIAAVGLDEGANATSCTVWLYTDEDDPA